MCSSDLERINEMTYAIIDPRDGYEIEYVEGREAALEYVRFLESSAAHNYRAQGIKLSIRALRK